jgi:site-specific recombinase XerC
MLSRKSIQGVGVSQRECRGKATNLRRGCPDREIWDTMLADGGAGVRPPSDLVAMIVRLRSVGVSRRCGGKKHRSVGVARNATRALVETLERREAQEGIGSWARFISSVTVRIHCRSKTLEARSSRSDSACPGQFPRTPQSTPLL